MIPDSLLIPIGDALRPWRAVVCAPHMPTPDVEAVLCRIIWAVHYAPLVTARIQEIAYEMAYQEALYEHAFLTPEERRAVFDATVFMCVAVTDQLLQLKAYRDGMFPYELEGLLPDDTLVLRRVPGGADGAKPT